MTGPDFSTALTTLGLDNHQAAAWLGVSVRAVQRYKKEGAPKVVERLLGARALLVEAYWDVKSMVLDAKIGSVLTGTRSLSDALDWRE